MSLTPLLITAVVVEKRPVPEVAASYGVSRSWVYRLLGRYRLEGEVGELIVELREKLKATGLDAGPDTIGWHLEHQHDGTVSRATISR